MGLSANITVRYKERPDKMALWNDFLPSIEETVSPTTRSDIDVPTKRSEANGKKGMTLKFICLV